MQIVCLLTRLSCGHYYMNEVSPYMHISERIRFAGSEELVKWVKALRRFVGGIQVELELGFEGVIWVYGPPIT